MKKTSVIAINLKPARFFLLSGIFFSVLYISIFLSSALPPIVAEKDFIRLVLSCNASYTNVPLSSVGVFSLVKKDITNPENTILSSDETDVSAVKVSVPQKSEENPLIKLSNATDLKINPEDYLASPLSFLKEDISVLIVHTHTTESYTPSEKYNFTPTDTDRTTDKNYNMVVVGNEIEKILASSGVKVYHDTSINDYPSYSGSYNKTATVIESYLKKDPSIKIVLDVHRDAIVGKSGEKIKYTTTINGETAAKIMFVTGSNLSGLQHDNWKENFSFAVQLQKHTLSLYPDLCRPINFRSQRFNQQLAPGGIIVEVGTNGNTLDEALLGARCFAVSLADFLNSQK